MALSPIILQTISDLDTTSFSQERKGVLLQLATYIQAKLDAKAPIRLNFICTHNSRRSHLSQVWAQALAHHFGIKHVTCYSGGTEATALFPVAAQTLERQGFAIQKLSQAPNPIYSIKYSADEPAVIGFSKRYDDPFNPQSGFGAVMTCSSANEGCPIVLGAEARFPLTFDDPKAFDDTPIQEAKYAERSLQIASELTYIFSQIKIQP